MRAVSATRGACVTRTWTSVSSPHLAATEPPVRTPTALTSASAPGVTRDETALSTPTTVLLVSELLAFDRS